MAYNWQQKDWPHFRYEISQVEDILFEYAEHAGRLSGMLKALPKGRQTEAIIELMVAEAIKTSEIEGEYFSREDVMSSIKNNLGLGKNPPVRNIAAEGIGDLMVDVRNTFADELTKEALFAWHTMVMKGANHVLIGEWRKHTEPMQVVSGALGKETVHFEAPPSPRVPEEMDCFIKWFNETGPQGDKAIGKPILRSAIAHLYFESIHPFEDGNGRIGRAISEKALSQAAGRPVVLSLSQAIEGNKKLYYSKLQQAQQSNKVTSWLTYFAETVLESQKQAESLISFTLSKAKFFDRFQNKLNERQLKVIKRMLKEGPEGFEGGMSAKKYMSIARTSKATATRDLQALVELKVLVPQGGGRSTRYEIDLAD